MPKRAPSRRAARAFLPIIAVSAGEAGLLEACSGFSDTLVAVPGNGARGKSTVLRVISLRAPPNGFLNLGPQPFALQLLPQRLQRRADDAGF